MKSNYEKLGGYIRLVDERNKDCSITRLLGVSIEKSFIESIANTIGTDMSTYKIVKKGQFAYGPVTSRNGDKISIALLEEDECIISSSYSVFEIIDTSKLLPEYLNLWFKRPEFDRYARFHSHGSAREIFDWAEMCNVELPIPEIDEQIKIINAYKAIEHRIALKRRINDNLEAQATTIFKNYTANASNNNSIYDILTFITGAALLGILDQRQQEMLKTVLLRCLDGYSLSEETRQDKDNYGSNSHYLDMFVSAKRVEGCSEKTVEYYTATIRKLLVEIKKDIKDIMTDDIRTYLSEYQELHNSSKVTMDNMRRIFSSFFSWLEDEDYIVKSPVRRIHKVKTAKVIKETFTDEAMEVLRDTCTDIRNLAMIELLASAGIRVGELVLLNRTDIDFNERSCIVLGKGDKEREVYFDARTKLHLQAYLQTRRDDNPALIVSLKAPFNRLSIGGVEKAVKKLGEQAQIHKVHPHKFRRTLATMAIDKGMPIEQVQNLLGHKNINTTMQYARKTW